MKIRKRLVTPSGDLPLVYEDVRLELSAPGRAVFQVVSKEPVSGFVAFAVGYVVDDWDAFVFAGYVERCTTMDGSQQRLMCREIAAKLDTPIPLAMRHPRLREVLAAYADKTGLRFILPKRPYADTKIPAFDTFGTGWPTSAAPSRFPITSGRRRGMEKSLWGAGRTRAGRNARSKSRRRYFPGLWPPGARS